MLKIEMLDDEGNVTEVCEAEVTEIGECDDHPQANAWEVYSWTSPESGMEYHTCRVCLEEDDFARLQASEKTASLTVTVGSNPTFKERYFIDFRDTTGGRNRQLRTWYKDRDDVLSLLAKLGVQAAKADVYLTVVDSSGEIRKV